MSSWHLVSWFSWRRHVLLQDLPLSGQHHRLKYPRLTEEHCHIVCPCLPGQQQLRASRLMTSAKTARLSEPEVSQSSPRQACARQLALQFWASRSSKRPVHTSRSCLARFPIQSCLQMKAWYRRSQKVGTRPSTQTNQRKKETSIN